MQWHSTKRQTKLAILMIILLCIWDGLDRWKLQKKILRLEYQADGIMLASDMLAYRQKHPFKPAWRINETSQEKELVASSKMPK